MDTSKIIRGVVSNGRYTVTAPIVKEDYGLYLKIEGVELPSTYEVDFSNSENNGTSVTMIGNADGVLIPSQFISTGKDVFAFLYHVGADYGRTVYKFRIPNKVRPDRTEEQPTPEEQSVIDQAISALNSAVEQTAQDVIDADASAQNASADAERAEEARTDAQNYATQAEQAMDDAQTYANNASASATASAQSASQSAQIKSDVEGMVDDAQGYANSASQSASASAQSASDAQGYANSASASAQSASDYASSAQTSAQTASAKASEASTSASTASQKATEASQSASQALSYKTDAESAKTASQTAQGLAESARDSAQGYAEDAQGYAEDAQASAESISASASQIAQNTADIASLEEDRYKPYVTDSASGVIASFPDGADDLPLKSLIVDINPVQDLHGQDAPYPAGGGKNLFDIEKWFSDNNVDYTKTGNSYSLTLKTTLYSSPFYFSDEDVTVSISAKSITDGTSVNARIYLVDKNGNVVQNSTINSGTLKRENLVAAGVRFDWNSGGTVTIEAPQIELGSTATSYAPYENICPISGWTEVQTNQSGVNVWDEEYQLGFYNTNGGFATNTNGYFSSKNKIPVKPSTDYAFCIVGKARQTFYVCFYGKDGAFVERIGYSMTDGFRSLSIPSNVYYINFSTEAFYGTTYNHDISINYPSTDHDYHPYTGRSITISLGQTVYGGKLDVLSGELVIDRAMVDLGTLAWRNNGANSAYTTALTNKLSGGDNCICSVLVKVAQGTGADSMPNASFKTYADSVNVAVKLSGITGDSAATMLSGFMFCYPLATPITVQLSPNQINSLYGVNNLWADSGDTEVEYRANTKLYIERLTAPDSADMIADSNITSGQYFMVGNNLFKSTANIANGSAIIVGTNCIRKSLSEALNEINA